MSNLTDATTLARLTDPTRYTVRMTRYPLTNAIRYQILDREHNLKQIGFDYQSEAEAQKVITNLIARTLANAGKVAK